MPTEVISHSETHGAFWLQRRVMITGCHGFLGRSLASVLLSRGACVVGFSRHVEASVPVGLIQASGRIEDYAALQRALAEHAIDTVFHLAAQSTVGAAASQPLATFETNIQGSWNILEACRQRHSDCRLVLLSSEKVYGSHPELAVCDENTSMLADSPYAVSKLCCELLVRCYWRSYGLAAAVARCSNLYGPADFSFSRIIPGTIAAILANRRPVINSDGSPRRDFVFVDDIVTGLLGLAEQLHEPAVVGQAFNFASGKPVSILALTELLLEIAGRPDLVPDIRHTAAPEATQPTISPALAENLLHWHPATDLHEGLRQTFLWYQEHGVTAS